MSPTILPIIIQLVQAGIALLPGIISAGKLELDLLGSHAVPATPEQRAEIMAALDSANDALQNAQPAP